VEYSAAPFETPEGVRGTVLLFSDVSERRAREARVRHDLEDLAWVGRINDAIEQDRLVLHAQPIIDVATGATVQHELLIRMLDVDGTLVAPGHFLPPAERYGLIREIDRWVVSRAAGLAAQGHAVELNLSAESIGDAYFATMVERELQLSGADCSLIVVELTETALLRDEDAGRRFIELVQRLGCQLALDDFGTGYASFTYLKRLAVDYLKIDIEFVRDLPRNAASRHVVRAVVNLAQGFGQKTVAEGVEDAETLDLLRELGVDFAQGYHIGRPAPLGETLVLERARARG
jgi:EAL domain-containing protein (putative c-di-GMP-specific phosphodiesterase class I)